MTGYVPTIGSIVEHVEWFGTSNWTRPDLGRRSRVVGYEAAPTRFTCGPRVSVLVQPLDCRAWDSANGLPWHCNPASLASVEQVRP